MNSSTRCPIVVFLCALFVVLFCSSFSYFILDHTPRLHDEIAYNFQAKLLLSGRLYAPSPNCADSFDFPHIVNNGRWYAQYPPGFPALISLGLLVKVPWLINPLLAGLSIFLFFFLGKEMYDRKVGAITAVLGSLSIWHLVLSSTMMSHTSSMFFMTLFLLFLFKSIKSPTLASGMAAGASLGMMLVIRPLDTVLLSIPFLFYFGIIGLRSLQTRFRTLLGFVLVMGIFVGILFTYNTLTNGQPFTMGYMVYLGEGRGLGFGSMVYDVHEHNAFLGFQNIGGNLASYSRLLFGWPITSFFAVLALLLIRGQEKANKRKDLLLASSFLCQVVGLVFYWGAFAFLGPRLLFSTLPLMLLLSARGISELERLLAMRQKILIFRWAKTALWLLILVFTAYAFGISLPRWARAPGSEWFFERIDHHFALVNPDIHNSIKSVLPEGSLVIFNSMYHPLQNFPTGGWGSGFLQNSPDLEGEIIYARDLGEKNAELISSYPNRKIFMYLGLIDKGMLFPLRLVQGGLEAGNALPTDASGPGHIAFFRNPIQFYKMYSSEFRSTVTQLYSNHAIWEVDAKFLFEKGRETFQSRSYTTAVHYLEAALQVEMQPFFRYQMLNLLAVCYLKSGDTDAARTIQTCLRERKKIHMYDVMPDRGY